MNFVWKHNDCCVRMWFDRNVSIYSTRIVVYKTFGVLLRIPEKVGRKRKEKVTNNNNK